MQAASNFTGQPGTHPLTLFLAYCGLRFLTWVTRKLEKVSSPFPELVLEVKGRERQKQKSKSTVLSWVGKGRSVRLNSLKPRAESPAAKIQIFLVITEMLALLLQAHTPSYSLRLGGTTFPSMPFKPPRPAPGRA